MSNVVTRKPVGIGRTILRLSLWTIAGGAIGLLMIPAAGFFERYPLVAAFVNISAVPAAWMGNFWASQGFGPHGDQGFVMIFVFAAVEWAMLGFLAGLGRTWFLLARSQSAAPKMPAAERSSKIWLWCTVALVTIVVGGYCLERELAIAHDRRFFLEQVDYKSFAEGCLDVVVNPDKYGVSSEKRVVDEAKLPPGIQRLQPTTVHYGGYAVSVHKLAYFQELQFRHNFDDATQYDVWFQSNYGQPILLYSLHSTNMPKLDWH